MKLTFAERLKIERERAGLSQIRLARLCGFSSAMISCLECGQSAGSEKVLAAVARVLGVRPAWLRSGSGTREADWCEETATAPSATVQPFPERIKQLRQEAGLSQRELAELVGVSKAAVSCWETGVRGIPAGDNLVRLAEILGLDPAEIMKVDGKSFNQCEVQLLAAFRVLSKERQAEAVKLVKALK